MIPQVGKEMNLIIVARCKKFGTRDLLPAFREKVEAELQLQFPNVENGVRVIEMLPGDSLTIEGTEFLFPSPSAEKSRLSQLDIIELQGIMAELSAQLDEVRILFGESK